MSKHALAKDMFVHRIQGIKEKLHCFEDFVQAQMEEPRARDSRSKSVRGSRCLSTEEAEFKQRDPETERHGRRMLQG